MYYLDSQTPASIPARKKRKRGKLYKIKKWYRTRTQVMKAGIWCSLVLTYLFLCSCIMAAAGTMELAIPSSPTPSTMNLATVIRKTPALPTREATSTPTSIPTHTPTPTPIPTQPSTTQLTVTFTCAQATDFAGGSVCVHTRPGAVLTITVRYCSGHNASSKSLKGVFYANTQGDFTWRWVPQTVCKGSALATVTARWHGQHRVATKHFVVH